MSPCNYYLLASSLPRQIAYWQRRYCLFCTRESNCVLCRLLEPGARAPEFLNPLNPCCYASVVVVGTVVVVFVVVVVTGNNSCQPSPMCSVPYFQASWYCRGKGTCRGMLIERQPLHRRTCGADYTNCLHVQYRCVKSELSTNSSVREYAFYVVFRFKKTWLFTFFLSKNVKSR